MMCRTRKFSITFKRVRHATLVVALQAFNDDVRSVSGNPKLAECQLRRFTWNFSFVHEFKPRKIRQVPFPAGQQESDRKHRGVSSASSADATLVLIFSPIGPPLVLFQTEDPRIHGSQRVA